MVFCGETNKFNVTKIIIHRINPSKVQKRSVVCVRLQITVNLPEQRTNI